MGEPISKLEMVLTPVQGIDFGRLELRLGSDVQNLPAALENRVLSCPSFWSSGPGFDKENTEQPQERSYA